MESVTLTLTQAPMLLILESIFQTQELVITAKSETGLLFTGLDPSQTAELSLTQELSQVVFQRLSLSELLRSSDAGILQFHS